MFGQYCFGLSQKNSGTHKKQVPLTGGKRLANPILFAFGERSSSLPLLNQNKKTRNQQKLIPCFGLSEKT